MLEFDGTGDPHEHIAKFHAKADLYQVIDAIYIKVFRTTFSKNALTWFNQLPVSSTHSLETLMTNFFGQFSINRKYPKPPNQLFKYVQKDKSLRQFMQQFMSYTKFLSLTTTFLSGSSNKLCTLENLRIHWPAGRPPNYWTALKNTQEWKRLSGQRPP